jgi:oligopeptide transport system substrate-binding protein
MSALTRLPHFLLVAVLAVIGAACGGSAAESGGNGTLAGRASPDTTVFYKTIGEPEQLDPGFVMESEGGEVLATTFERLLNFNPEDMTLQPGVATSWTVSDDGLTYTFRLRPDAKWSDGVAITAHDFEYSWLRALAPETGSEVASLLWKIEGAEAYTKSTPENRAAAREAVAIEAANDSTFRVRLVHPVAYFDRYAAFAQLSPVPRHVIEEHGDQWSRPENMVSNGPWTVTEWATQQRIVAERNPHYWNAEAIPFDRVEYLIAQANMAQWNMFEAGQVDILNRVPQTFIPRLRREQPPAFHEGPFLATYFYMFNVNEPPVDDVRVRRALNLAIDKSKIGTFVLKGGQDPGEGPTHPLLAGMGYTPPEAPAFDPQQARTLLAEAGYPGGEGFPPLKISYNTLESHKAVAEFVQQEWSKNLGVNVELENMEWKVFLDANREGDFQIARRGWIPGILDPKELLDIWKGDEPVNVSGWANARFDALLEESDRTVDQEARLELLAEAERVWLEDAPGITLYYYRQHNMVQPWVDGFAENMLAAYPTRHFSIRTTAPALASQ